MSSINNVITTTFKAVGGNVVSQLNAYSSGFGRLGASINESTNMSSRLNNQWRALGTTIRYSIAGAAVFGLTRMIGQLAAVNTQLGQMQALTSIGQGAQFSDTQMGQLLNGLMQTSIDTITPLNEVNDAAINFLSTVQNPKATELPKMLSDIGMAAKISQASIEDVTQAATTSQIAFGRKVNPQSIGQYTRMFQWLIGVAPGGRAAGSTIAQQMPGLASMFMLAPGHAVAPRTAQAQLMALTQGVLMTGMPAASGMRGLTFLLQSIAQPKTAASKQALAGIGVTPEFVSQHGIFAGVMKMLQTIKPVGKTEAMKLGAIPDETLDMTNALPGISPQQMTQLGKMIPRIHGIRAAIILASQLNQRGDVQSIAQDLTNYVQVQNENSRQAKKVKQAADDMRKNARMQDAAVALHAAGISIAATFNPLFNAISGGAIGGVESMLSHPKAAHRATVATVGILGALGVARFTGLAGKIPGPIGRFIGNTNAVQMYGRERAITAAMAGNTALGASPANPVYVTVVSTLYGNGTNPDNPNQPGGGFHPFGWIKGAGRRIGGTGSYLSRLIGKAPGAAGAASMLALQYGDEIPALGDYIKYLQSGGPDPTTGQPIHAPLWKKILGSVGDFDTAAQYQHALARANRTIGGGHITGIESMSRGMWKGRLDMNLQIDQRDPTTGKIITKRVHVPVDIWSGGRTPSVRGNAGKTVRVK